MPDVRGVALARHFVLPATGIAVNKDVPINPGDTIATTRSREEIARRGAGASPESAWRIEQEGFDPAREHSVETIFTVGNGYLGVRGVLDTPLPGSPADMFIAGIYDKKQPQQPYSENEFLHVGHADYPYTELVSVPFPFRVRVTVAGVPLGIGSNIWRMHRRTLDLHHGVLHRETVFETEGMRRTTLRSRRCASAADLHLLLQEVRVSLDNHSAAVEIDVSLADPGLAANHPHLVPLPLQASDAGVELHCFKTHVSGYIICIAARSILLGHNENVRWDLQAMIGETLVLRRYVVVYTSRDTKDPQAAAVAHLRKQHWAEFDEAFSAHETRWGDLWHRADIVVPDRPATEQALRFQAYHLFIAADNDPRVSVGARTLSGRAYEGHVFWDVEVFMLPFYFHTRPDIARCLLLYRYHTLDAARRRSHSLGLRGACYSWESTVTGDDVTPSAILLKTQGKQIPIFTGDQQIHVTADVAYGVSRYFEATQDAAFMRDAGVEILIETARFWASRVVQEGSAYHIRGVVGPDEYHHSVNDNTYTNWMARFNLEKARWAVAWMQREDRSAWESLAGRVAFDNAEVETWSAVARALYIPAPNSEGVIEQFEGFFDLDDYSLPKEERFKAPISRLFEWDKINQLKIIKQADVLMLPHLFPDAFPHDVVAANYHYYEPITDHGSSLSPSIHAAVAARLGLNEDAERYWRQSLWLDLSNVMGNNVLGVHAACMGGTWQALVFGFLGIRFTEDGPVPDSAAASRLPRGWQKIALQLAWRGRMFPVEVQRGEEVL